MRVGVLQGDLSITVTDEGTLEHKLVLATAYNVLPIWVHIASRQLSLSREASEAVTKGWGTNDDQNRQLLMAELGSSLQVIVACGIALDALYDQLKPFAQLTDQDVEAWKKNRTGRGTQIADVIRRVFRLENALTKQFRQNVETITKYRDLAVHPSFELKQACNRPDIPSGVDWKFSAYRFENARKCYKATLEMLVCLIGRKAKAREVNEEMERVCEALVELGALTLTKTSENA